MNPSRSMPKKKLSSRPGQAPDRHSMRLVLQSCLERLDRLDRRVHEEIEEVRSVFRNLLDNCQSDVTMEDSGRCDSTVDFQAGLDGLNAIPPFVSSQDHCFMPSPVPHRTSFGDMGSLSEGTGPTQSLLPYGTHSSDGCGPIQPSLTRPQYSMYPEAYSALHDLRVTESSSEDADLRPGQLFQDSSLCGMSNSVHEPAAQPFQGIYFEKHVLSSSSARSDEQLSIPIIQANKVKDKVKCTWNGCSALVNKDNLTRHVKEVHEGQIKAVCAGCRREFKRPYQLSEHILRSGCGKS
ncbi:hypothetical protein BDR04DRAFT_1144909 [Suillus decipiens]|nr:hypothetical protein BDR04DRAFT_1144909 [Suillus decipiens]